MSGNIAYARLIVNPAAGAGKTARLWPIICAYLEKIGVKFDHDVTEAPGHAMELTRTAVSKGYQLIVPVGGDGTINEVVNGLYVTGSLNSVAMGIIGTGTGGDYIRTIGVPRNYIQACERLSHPAKITTDLGMVEHQINGKNQKRLFANFAGLGFDAEIVKATTKKFKKLGSVPAYLLGLFSTLVTYENRKMSITLDGQTAQRKVCTLIASIGKYAGGSMLIAPQAIYNDGLFDVICIGDVSKPDLLYSLPRVYRGTHLTHPKITLTRVRQLDIVTTEETALQADGELLGNSPARITILPAALNLVV